VELAVATVEARAGEAAEPELVGERGAREPHGLVRREAEEDLLEKLVRQRRCWCQRRRHGRSAEAARVWGSGLGWGIFEELGGKEMGLVLRVVSCRPKRQ
jgi:hypothetical protein